MNRSRIMVLWSWLLGLPRTSFRPSMSKEPNDKPSCIMTMETIFIEGFESFRDFKNWLLSQYPQTPEQLSVDRENAVMFFPWEGGLIILKSDGTWSFDVTPFSD